MRSKISAFASILLAVTLISPLGVSNSVAATNPGLSCSSGAPKVSTLHAPIFYEDLSVGFNAQWAGYRIDAANVSNVIIGSDTAKSRLLTRTTNPIVNVVNNSYSTVYALFEDVGPKNGNLTHTLAFSVGSTQFTCTFNYKSVVNAPGTPGPTVNNLSTANLSYKTTAPIIYSGSAGKRIWLAADGQAGVVEQNSLIALSPTPKITWDPSINLQLVSVRWTRGDDPQTYRDQLWFASGSMSSNNSYHVEYEFAVDVNGPTTWQMSPAIYVQDSVSVEHSTQNGSAQFSVIDEPNTEFHTAINHAFTGILTVAGGNGTYQWALEPGQNLPTGLQLSSDGKITGTPTELGGPTPVAFKVTSANGASKIINATFYIEEASISSNLSANGYLDSSYGPIRINIAGMKKVSKLSLSGNLPPGLIFSNGTISGVPTTLGTYAFTISASGDSDAPLTKDNNGNSTAAKNVNAQRTYRVTVLKTKPITFQNYQAGFIDLQLGSGNPSGEVVATSPSDNWGYAVVYKNACDSSQKIYTNSDPNTSQTNNPVGPDHLSSSTSPYKVRLHDRFCLQADVLIDKKSAQPPLEIKNLKVKFDFYKLDNSGAVMELLNPSWTLDYLSSDYNKLSDCATYNQQYSSSMTFCLGSYSFKNTKNDFTPKNPITIKFPLKVADDASHSDQIDLNLIRVHVQVTSDNREYDNINDYNGGKSSECNNGFGNGDQSAPGNSGSNNNAENSDGDTCSYTGKNSNNSVKSSSTSITSVNSSNINTTKSASECNNGFGNGDQSAPGNSGSNNNAENSGGISGSAEGCPGGHAGYCINGGDDEDGSDSSLISPSSSNESDEEDGSEDGTGGNKCAPAEDYNNIAEFWLGQEAPPTITVNPPTQGPTGNNPIPTTIPPSPGFNPNPEKKYYVVTCYQFDTKFTVPEMGLPGTTEGFGNTGRNDKSSKCYFATTDGSNSENKIAELGNQLANQSQILVKVPGFNLNLCQKGVYYTSTQLFEAPSTFDPSNFTYDNESLIDMSSSNTGLALFENSINLLATDPNVGQDAKPADINADPNTSECFILTTSPALLSVRIGEQIQDIATFTPEAGYTLPNGSITFEYCKVDTISNTNWATDCKGNKVLVGTKNVNSGTLIDNNDGTFKINSGLVDAPGTVGWYLFHATFTFGASGIKEDSGSGETFVVANQNQPPICLSFCGFVDPCLIVSCTPPPPPPPNQPPLPEPTPNEPVDVLPKYIPVAECSGSSFCTQIDVKKAEQSFPAITGNQGRFVASGGLIMLPPGIPAGWVLAFPESSIPQFKGKALFSLNTSKNGIVVTSDTGWTGFLHINGIAVPPKTSNLRANIPGKYATSSTPAGIKFALDIQIYPDPPKNGTYKNTEDGKTLVNWAKSETPTTVGYELYVNGVKLCTTKTLSCTLDKLIGPRSTMTVVAIGGSKTRSNEAKPVYQAAKYALSLVVHYDTAKAILKPADKKALDMLVAFVKREGYKKIYVVGHTDPRLKVVNLSLSKARAQVVIAYLAPKLKGVTFSGTGIADKVPYSKGKGNLSLALNRRAEVFVK